MTDIIEPIEPLESALQNLHSIKVFGIGGCGNNAVNHMIQSGLSGPIFVAANSDLQDLNRCLAPIKIQVGVKCTRGLGCGGDPEMGRQAAEEDIDVVKEQLEGANIVFITAGLGGGTGTGGAPVVAEALSRLDNPPLVVSVVTMPFNHERGRVKLSEKALRDLTRHSNCVITVPNAKLIKVLPHGTLKECRAMADDVLLRAVSSITDIIQRPSEFNNLDFSDIREAMAERGQAIMGYGQAEGEGRALKALKQAISSPLIADLSIKGAKSILVNITADSNLRMDEFMSVNEALAQMASANAAFFSGAAVDESLAKSGVLKVTVLASGLVPGEVEPIDVGLAAEPMAADPEPVSLGSNRGPQGSSAGPPPVASGGQSRPGGQAPRQAVQPVRTARPRQAGQTGQLGQAGQPVRTVRPGDPAARTSSSPSPSPSPTRVFQARPAKVAQIDPAPSPAALRLTTPQPAAPRTATLQPTAPRLATLQPAASRTATLQPAASRTATLQPATSRPTEWEAAEQPAALRSLCGQTRVRANATFYSKYEENSSVDPINGRPNLYDWPPFMKGPAS
ncbi:MAG: cell division protein FtsZ [Deltaproteobacteria bacterium]|nr:cell division protein FtsZ [Deltaproteobacteria bacterium]